MLDKKQIQVIFLFGFRMGCKKQQRQFTVWAMHLAQELLMNVQCSGGSRGFAKEMRALKMRSAVASHWKLTVTNWEQSLRLILLQLHKKLPPNSTAANLWSFSIWSKWERWKSSVSDCLMNWQQIIKKKKGHFEVSSFLLLHNNKPFLSWFVVCDDKWILYNNWQWLVQWLGWEAPKA